MLRSTAVVAKQNPGGSKMVIMESSSLRNVSRACWVMNVLSGTRVNFRVFTLPKKVELMEYDLKY